MKKLLIIMGILMVIISCKKEVVPNNGIYRGVFRETDSNGDTLASGVMYLALIEDNLQFTVVGDSVSNAPASHSGMYVVDNKISMQFFYSGNYDTLYDQDHYLDTIYNYEFDNENFKFWQTRYGKTYTYDLVRD